MYEILLVNDDGLYSPGLRALFPIFSDKYDLTVVAPSSQRSWLGKAISYDHSLKYRSVTVDSFPAILFDGTSADCAIAGIYHFCRRKPDLLISGINVGANIGDSYILSSGTVGGALEGTLAGIPSIAVGMEFSPKTMREIDSKPLSNHLTKFEYAAKFTGRLARCLLTISLPSRIRLFNLNFDEGAHDGSAVVITKPARYNYGNLFEKRNGKLFHKGSIKDLSKVKAGTDMAAIRDGKISLSILDDINSVPFHHTYSKRLIEALDKEK